MVYALIGAVAIGLSLGLLGSGGSIITVPILVYLVGHPEKQAIAEALAIVGAIALIGAARTFAAGKIDRRAAVFFGLPGIPGAAAGSQLAHFIPGEVQVLLLAVVMLFAAWRMARVPPAPPTILSEPRKPTLALIAMGFGVGLITGLVGVGGGFLIVPALVLLAGVSMRIAVGTSLAIIAINAATGFLSYQHVLHAADLRVNWRIIGLFTALGVCGLVIGGALGARMRQATLRRWFGVFLVLMAVYILFRQIPKVL